MRRWSMENRVVLAIVAGGGIVLILWAVQMLLPESPPRHQWIIWALAAALVFLFALRLRKRVLAPVQSLANILEAIRYEDYGLRVRGDRGGVMNELAREINLLAMDLRNRAREEQESRALLEKVMQEIDLPLFTFDVYSRLVIANPAAEKLTGSELESGTSAEEIGVAELLEENGQEPVSLSFPGEAGRFVVRHRPFRMEGKPHTLLVLAEVTDALRAERREAWQRLVRVLGHEINNSLAPIKSIAETLRGQAARQEHEINRDAMKDGLSLIADRANSLGRFISGYATLARLPTPDVRPLEMEDLATRVSAMEPRVEVGLDGPAMQIEADPDQLEQVLINLVKNAADSVEGTDGSVDLRWGQSRNGILIEVLDEGVGPPESENLFVPFFTTKPGGSGIGLLLARRIAELHDGWLTLARRDDVRGAVARLWLPG